MSATYLRSSDRRREHGGHQKTEILIIQPGNPLAKPASLPPVAINTPTEFLLRLIHSALQYECTKKSVFTISIGLGLPRCMHFTGHGIAVAKIRFRPSNP